MTHCIRCHRPLKRPTESGMGRVCAARFAAPVPPVVDRDLFGYDIAKACDTALQRVAVHIESLAADAHAGYRAAVRAARRGLGVRS